VTMRKSTISVAVLAAMPIGAASAADMPVKAPPPAPAPYVAYNWTGFYIGPEIGGGWGSETVTVVEAAGPSFPVGSTHSTDYSGFLGGVYGGYNYQINQFLVGIEGDYTWADLTGDSTEVSPFTGDIEHNNVTVDWIATATGRLGYAANNWLFYAKGGWAWAGFNGNSTLSNPAQTETIVQSVSSSNRDGWTVGGGIEWGFSQHMSFKLEYDYVKFNTADFNTIDPLGGFCAHSRLIFPLKHGGAATGCG
jgi:outer membrane immunogenic protein